MGLSNLSSNISSILSNNVVNVLSPELTSKINNFISISKIVIFCIIGYILFIIIIKNFLTWKKNKRIKIIYFKIKEINKKLDLLLKKSNFKKIPDLEKKDNKLPESLKKIKKTKKLKKMKNKNPKK